MRGVVRLPRCTLRHTLWPCTIISLQRCERIDLGASSATGNFEVPVHYGLYDDTTYYVKSFVATENYFVFGQVVSFESNGSASPVIEGFTPAQGTWGDTVVLAGKHFSTAPESDHVKFGAYESQVVWATDSTLGCVVPEGIGGASVPITLSVFQREVAAPATFVFTVPDIESFSPTQGTFDDIIEITGAGFSPAAERNVVKFNEHVAEVISASPGVLKVKVPRSIRAKENKISITVNMQSDSTSGSFVILPPVISSLSPNAAHTGEAIEIRGQNFNPDLAGNTVSFGTVKGIVSGASTNLLTVVLSGGIFSSRSFNVAVTVAEQTAVSYEVFTVQNPWLRKTNMPASELAPGYHATAFSIDGTGYALQGGVLWNYDPETDTWREEAKFPGTIRSGRRVSWLTTKRISDSGNI